MSSLINNLINLDILLFYSINFSYHTVILDLIAKSISLLGTKIILLVIIGLIFLIGDKEDKQIAILSFFSLMFADILVYILKLIFLRPRPYITLDNVELVKTELNYSFPSGHATLSFAVYTLIGYKYKKFILAILIASIISITRIYLGVHYPSDIIFGAILGVLITLILIKIEEKYRTIDKLYNKLY